MVKNILNKKIIIGIILILLIGAIVVINIAKSKGSDTALSSGQIYTVKVENIVKGSISATVSASGVVEEIEKTDVFFDTPLKVKKIFATKNGKVTKGQKLVELDLDSMNYELQQLRISLANAQADALRAQNNILSLQRVYNDSKKNFENSKVLYEAEAISKNELDAAEKTVSDALSNFEYAKASRQISLAGTESVSVTNDQNLLAARLKVSDLENRIRKITDATMSPIDGVVTEISITEGAFTSNMQPSLRIVNPNKLRVQADIKEFDIKDIAVGQKVKISGDAFTKGEEITGIVESISSIAKKSQTVGTQEVLINATIALVKSSPVMKPGISVTCDIITNEKNDVVLASYMMLKDDKDGNKFVFVVDAKNKSNIMHERKIKIGITSDLTAEVIEGLQEGESVVLDPLPNYKDGAKVKINKNENK